MRARSISKKIWVALFDLLICTCTATVSFAQSDGYSTNNNLRGVVPFGTYQFGEIDNINLASGTVNLRIPLVSRPGRGISEGLDYVYSSKIWIVRPIPDPNNPTDWRNSEANIKWLAWEPSTEMPNGQIVYTGPRGWELFWTENWYTCTYINAYGYPDSFNVVIKSNFSLRAPDGASYQFPNRKVIKDNPSFFLSNCITPLAGSPPPPTDEREIFIGYSDSGTMELDTTGTDFLVRFKDGSVASYNGTQVGPSFQWFKDRNGNLIDNNGDTLKRSVFKSSDGQALGFSIEHVDLPTTTQFPTIEGCVFQFQGFVPVTTSLTLPNGQRFTFEYDPVFRELTRVNLPTGGYIRYVYQTLPAFDDAPPILNNQCINWLDSRRVVERRVSTDGVNERVWTYSYTRNTQTGEIVVEVTDPLGNVSRHWFGNNLEYKTETLNSAGLVLRRTTHVWDSDLGPVQVNQDGTHRWDMKNKRIVSTTTTLLETNQVSKTETDYDQFSYPILLPHPYDHVTESRMNVIETREYDYGIGTPGPLLRRTTYTYNTSSNYLSRHIWGLVTSKKVYDGSGTSLHSQKQSTIHWH